VLSSDDVGSYGRDIDTDLVQLLREMLKEDGKYSIHIRYIEPAMLVDLFPELYTVLKSNKIRSFLS